MMDSLNIQITHTYREANYLADHIANIVFDADTKH